MLYLEIINGRRLALVLTALFLSSTLVAAQRSAGTLRGQVADMFGGVIIDASVTATDAAGVERSSTTDEQGQYAFVALPPGRYTVRATATGFDTYVNTDVEITAGGTAPLNIVLPVTIEDTEVTVTSETALGTEPDANLGAIIIRGTDLDALPDDPDDLADALQALAGPSTGPQGEGEIFIDGFTGGRLPPKDSIREVRINRNPFSAEYDRLGFGRIEIFTKPGTDTFRGQGFFNFNDESLNSRNPFAPTRAPYQSRRYGGNVSGPLVSKKASFFFDFERRETDDNDVVNAVVLDSALNPVAFNATLLTPVRRTTFSPRLDWQLNSTNTLVARYTFETTSRTNQGVGDFNLPERAFNTENTQHTVQLTETAIINQKVINETRFQYERNSRLQEGGTFTPTLRVLDAFTGGGAQVGRSFNEEDNFELQNFTSWAWGDHALKAGARLRHTRLLDSSEQNFAGTFTFTSLEQYRDTLLGVAGARPAQFSISAGTPEARISRADFSPFIQDDWRVRPNLTLSAGLRYDWQSRAESSLNFAPRLAFAWSPDGGDPRSQKTVIRGGFGVFYDFLNENLLLQAARFNGLNQQQFLITSATPAGAAMLDLFPVVPSVETLQSFAVPQTLRRLAEDIKTPYTLQTALSVERQLPRRTSLSVSFVNARTLNLLRSRNLNAPLTGATGLPLRDSSGSFVRPMPGEGNIFQYESSGRFDQQQLIVNLSNRLSRRFTVSANYVLNRARSDTEGASTFPVNQFDLSGEYGRSLQDIRHRFFLFGNISGLPWDVRLSPIVILNSGRPFNITTGRDSNGDTIFNERPAFATDLTDTGVVITRYGAFDTTPSPGQEIIPRNFGTGSAFATVNLRLSKSFGFGPTVEARAGGAGGGRRGGGRRGGFGGRRGGGGDDGGGASERSRYDLNFSVSVQNLLNHTNENPPVGNLSSPLFGQSVSTAGGFGRGGGAQAAGNRRIELQLRFNF